MIYPRLVCVIMASLALGVPARAAQTYIYLGWGSPSTPGFTEENYIAYAHSDGHNSIDDLAYLLYYTPTGFTGTSRDTFEFWTGLDVGYANPSGQKSDAGGFGVAIPNIGIEYYYNVLQPKVAPGAPGYETFWVSPEFEANFPNGNNKAAGFGAGANAFSLGSMLEAYYQRGNFALTIEPLGLSYAFRSLTPTASSLGDMLRLRRDRGGLGATLGVFAAGWQVAPALFAGVFHSYNLYSFAGTNMSRGSEGTLGPTLSYSGLFKACGVVVDATIQTDYVRSRSLPRSTILGVFASKHF